MTNQLIYVDDTTDGICSNAGLTLDNGVLTTTNGFECYGDLRVGTQGTFIRENGNMEIGGLTSLQGNTYISGNLYLESALGRPVTGYNTTHGTIVLSGDHYYVSGGTDGVASLVFELENSHPGNDTFIQCSNIDGFYMYVTPNNFYDGHTLEFTAKDQYAHLIWTDSHWKVFEHTCIVKQHA